MFSYPVLLSLLFAHLFVNDFVVDANGNSDHCSHITADYESYADILPGLSFKVEYKYTGNRVVAKVSFNKELPKSFDLTSKLFNRAKDPANPINSTICFRPSSSTETVYCETSYEWKLPDYYVFEVSYSKNSVKANFLEAEMDTSNKLLILTNVDKLCTNQLNLRTPLRNYNVNYCACCEDYKPTYSECPEMIRSTSTISTTTVKLPITTSSSAVSTTTVKLPKTSVKSPLKLKSTEWIDENEITTDYWEESTVFTDEPTTKKASTSNPSTTLKIIRSTTVLSTVTKKPSSSTVSTKKSTTQTTNTKKPSSSTVSTKKATTQKSTSTTKESIPTEPPLNVTESDQYKINCDAPSGDMEQLFCQNSRLDSTNVGSYLNQTKQAFDPKKAQSIDIYMLSVMMEKVANVSNLTLHDTGQFYFIFDSLLEMSTEHFEIASMRGNASTRLLHSIDNLLKNSEHDLQLLNASNLAMQKYHTPVDCNSDTSFGIADYGEHGFGWTAAHKPVAKIEIPPSAACNNQKSTPMYFVAYRRTQLFTPPIPNKQEGSKSYTLNSLNQRFINLAETTKNTNDDDSEAKKQLPKQDRCKIGLLPQDNRVLTGTLLNSANKESTQNGDKVMARLSYDKNQVKTNLHSRHIVTWWSETEGWATRDQCKTTEVNGFFEAGCYHLTERYTTHNKKAGRYELFRQLLTDFTLLIDGSETDPSLCNSGLSIFGIVINVSSMISLIILGLIQFLNLFPAIKQRCYPLFYRFPWLRFRVELIAFQYTVTLFLFYLFFTVFDDQQVAGSAVGCQIFAALIYLLLVSCILLTLFQAWRVLKLFAWSSRMDYILSLITNDTVAISASIGAPILICIIAFLADHRFFNREDSFCWINPRNVIFAVVIPLSVLVLNCILCSIVMITKLYPNLRILNPVRRIVRTDSVMLSQAVKQKSRDRFFAILSVQIVLGLPWILQYLTLFAPTATAWHYLFSFANGSQGLILFVMFLYRRTKSFRASQNATTMSSNFESPNVNRTDTTDVQQQHRRRKLTLSLSND